MKITVLGNDTKEAVERRLKKAFSDLGFDIGTEDIRFSVETDGTESLKVTFDDGREVTLSYDEFLNKLEENVNDIKRDKRMQIVTSAGMLSRANGTVTDVYKSREGKTESNKKIAGNIIGYGHKTISEHDYVVLSLEDVTPVIEQIIIGYRLTSFTIKSRRNVDFRTAGFYTPDFKDKDGNVLPNNKELQTVYNNYMNSLFNKYGELMDEGLPVEDCRFILPYSFHSNIIMGCDCNELLRITSDFLYGKNSHITEVHELGEKLKEALLSYAPYLEQALEAEKDKKYYEEKYTFLDDILDDAYGPDYVDYYDDPNPEREEGKLLDKVKLTKASTSSDEFILCNILMKKYQWSYEHAKEMLYRLGCVDNGVRSKLMNDLIHARDQRELEQVSFSFEIPISLASLTHLTRHRMHSLEVPDFVPLWNMENYVTPKTIKESHNDEYQEIFTNNALMVENFREAGVRDEDLVYFYLAGNACNVYTTMNGRALMWISRMRCCNKAQWEINDIAKQMVAQASKKSPLLGNGLGPFCKVEGYCPEGKDSCKNRGVVVLEKKK